MYIIHNVLSTFPKVLTRRICLTIKSFFSWWSFVLFTWPKCVILGWYCKEKSHVGHSSVSKKPALFLRSHHTAGEMRSRKHRKICGGKSDSFLRSFYVSSWVSSVTKIFGFLMLLLGWSPWTHSRTSFLTDIEVFYEISNFTIIHTMFKKFVSEQKQQYNESC